MVHPIQSTCHDIDLLLFLKQFLRNVLNVGSESKDGRHWALK
jgi:hypothetical protein